MPDIEQLLKITSHRPWALPETQWRYYQEWNQALFLHWKVPQHDLQQLVPSGITLDAFEGEAWISLVAFTMEKIRPRNLPAVSFISDFHEINVRTYVTHNDQPGVYFINMEAGKTISAVTSRWMSGLPYEKSYIARKEGSYIASNPGKGFRLDAAFTIGAQKEERDALDNWLTERYCLYLDNRQKLYRYEVHHMPWGLYDISLSSLVTEYKIGNICLNRPPDKVHYSSGVKVIAWKKQAL